jgi:UDP-N-acetylmuramate dehydrogenase
MDSNFGLTRIAQDRAAIDISQKFQQQIVLAPYTTWGIGGAATYFLEPETTIELVAAYYWAWQRHLPFVVIGKGSNILIDDGGIDGVVVCTKNSLAQFWYDDRQRIFTATAGCHLARLALAAAKAEMAGFEFLICIPGTVGGAVAINAGVGGRGSAACIKNILLDVTVLDSSLVRTNSDHGFKQLSWAEFCDRVIVTLPASELNLSYRHSNISDRQQWLLSARFHSAQTASRAEILAMHRAILQKRVAKQPLHQRTSGSTFKQPANGNSAGWYIDQAGLKGHRIGGAAISLKHANWIENDGTATAQDVKKLIAHVQQTVRQQFDLYLEREVRFLPQDLLKPEQT